MKIKSRVRNCKIEFTNRHKRSLLGTQYKYKEKLVHLTELKEALKYIKEL